MKGLDDLQKVLAEIGLDQSAITNLKALAIQKKDKQHHIRLWRPYKTDIMNSEGKRIAVKEYWAQTGWLLRSQIEWYLQRGFALEPQKGALDPFEDKF